ncbi:hypothetical protein N665_1544s0009 [Sinapis alba]|nr:hypothetical protein N665_1544s0009 [Sinapis alba]
MDPHNLRRGRRKHHRLTPHINYSVIKLKRRQRGAETDPDFRDIWGIRIRIRIRQIRDFGIQIRIRVFRISGYRISV